MVITKPGPSTSQANSVKIQKDGKIVVGGYYSNQDGTDYDFALVRYNQNGSLDNSFGRGGIVLTPIGLSMDIINSVGIQSSGKIIAAGYSSGWDTSSTLERYNSDGSKDYSFGTDGVATTSLSGHDDEINSITILKNDKILTCGSSLKQPTEKAVLSKYNADGTVDTTFGNKGFITSLEGYERTTFNSLVIKPDRTILVSGSLYPLTNNSAIIVSYDSSGSLNTNFGTGGILKDFTFSKFKKLSVQTDGKIVAAGVISQGLHLYSGIVRFNADGTVDSSFGTSGGIIFKDGDYHQINTFLIQRDGKIVVSTTYRDSARQFDETYHLNRYSSRGKLDTGYIASTDQTNFKIDKLNEQSDGKIVGAGYTSSSGGDGNIDITRYNTDGSIDRTFGTVGKTSTIIKAGFEWTGYGTPVLELSWDILNAMTIQKDGKILAAGYINFYNNNDGYDYNNFYYYNHIFSSFIFLARYNGQDTLP